jgi:hypothetical protein
VRAGNQAPLPPLAAAGHPTTALADAGTHLAHRLAQVHGRAATVADGSRESRHHRRGQLGRLPRHSGRQVRRQGRVIAVHGGCCLWCYVCGATSARGALEAVAFGRLGVPAGELLVRRRRTHARQR